jgi:hypothetical protein
MYVCMHVCMYACMYGCMYVCIYVRICVSANDGGLKSLIVVFVLCVVHKLLGVHSVQ